MTLNFPPSTPLHLIVAELTKLGLRISPQREPDGSHNVIPLQAQIATPTLDLEELINDNH